MNTISINRMLLAMLVLAIIVSIPVDAYAAFESLISSGQTIFSGLRKIIYPASAIGIIAICMGGFFGNINWKWLTAIVVGLIVISCCVAFVSMFVPEGVTSKAISADVMSGG